MRFYQHCQDAASQRSGFDQMVTDQLPSYKFYLSMSQWAFVQIGLLSSSTSSGVSLNPHLLQDVSGTERRWRTGSATRRISSYSRVTTARSASPFTWATTGPSTSNGWCRMRGGIVDEPKRLRPAAGDRHRRIGRPFHEIPFDWHLLMGEKRWFQWIQPTVAFRGPRLEEQSPSPESPSVERKSGEKASSGLY